LGSYGAWVCAFRLVAIVSTVRLMVESVGIIRSTNLILYYYWCTTVLPPLPPLLLLQTPSGGLGLVIIYNDKNENCLYTCP
jgi:hypothetical protein